MSEYALLNIGGYKINSFRFDYQGAGASVGYDSTLGTTNGHGLITTYDGVTNVATGSYSDTLDGTAQTLVASGSFGRSGTDLGSLGGRLTSAQVVTNGSIVEFYESAVYNRVLSSAERNHLINYSKNRYRL